MEDSIFQTPLFQTLSPQKQEFLRTVHEMQKPKDAKNVSFFLQNLLKKARMNNITFSETESDLLISMIREKMPPQEQKKADLLLRMIKKR